MHVGKSYRACVGPISNGSDDNWPIARWIWRGGGDSARSNRTRIGVMILYLPVVLAALALLPLALILVPGYAGFVLGTGFLTLGFLRSRWEATVLPIPLETVPKIPQAA